MDDYQDRNERPEQPGDPAPEDRRAAEPAELNDLTAAQPEEENLWTEETSAEPWEEETKTEADAPEPEQNAAKTSAENPWAPAPAPGAPGWGFEPPTDRTAGRAPQYRMAESRPRRSHRGLLAALVICAALIVGLAGGIFGGMVWARRHMPTVPQPDLQQPERSLPEQAQRPEQAERPEQPPEAQTEQPGAVQETEGERPVDREPLVVRTQTADTRMEPADVYAANVDAVVAINTEGTSTNIWGQVSRFAASGSGFILSEDGYVVTNHHVIANANSITVTLTDGSTYEAELVGSDDQNDVALLKIDAQNLPLVTVGDSDQLRVGEMVAAIGNPLGELTNTLTVGYISALDREINTDGQPINMLQTDAAINSGNSGGPLFDMYGSVIGITTAKFASSPIEGLGFAIPINDAMQVIADLKMYGYVIGRPYFGVGMDDLSATTASYYNLPVGVYITYVQEGAAADRAGVQKGDILCSVDGSRCQNQTELSSLMKQYSAGDTAELEIYRGGEYLTLSITFDERPKQEQTVVETPTYSSGRGGFPFFGFGFGG